MSVSSLSTVADSTQAVDSSKKNGTLTQEDFLNIFITQMRYQNPLDPLDNNQMATQMAQFSSLEALNNMSNTLGNIALYQASINNLQAVGLIGKKIEALGNSLSIEEGKVSECYYQLSKSGKVTIQIYDANGNLVKTIEEGTKDTSKQTFAWDGKNDQGVIQPDGTYTIRVSAVDGNGQSISVDSRIIDTVTGIYYENGVVYINCGSRKITISDIIAVWG